MGGWKKKGLLSIKHWGYKSLYLLLIVIITSSLRPCQLFSQCVAKGVNYYTNGNFEEAITAFKQCGFESQSKFLFSWLNIGIIEYEKGNLPDAEVAVNNSRKLAVTEDQAFYLNAVVSLIREKKLTVPKSILTRYGSIDDQNEKLLLWQILWYANFDKNERKGGDIDFDMLKTIKNGVKPNTVQWAKVMLVEAMISFNKNEFDKMGQLMLETNNCLKKIGLENSNIFQKNVWMLFYYSDPAETKHYKERLASFENDSALLKNDEIRTAILFHKSRYFYKHQNYSQALNSIREAYHISPQNPTFILHLAFHYKKMQDYENALIYYRKLNSFQNYSFEANLGAAECAFALGKENESTRYYLSIIKDPAFSGIKLDTYYRLTYSLHTNRQIWLLDESSNAMLAKFSALYPKNLNVGQLYNYWGNYYWFKGEFDKANKNYQQAILMLLPNENNTDVFADLNFSESRFVSELAVFLNSKGETFYQISKLQKTKREEIKFLKECLKNLSLSIEQMSKYKMQLPGEEQMYVYSDLKSKRYPNIIKVCLELYKLTGDTYYEHLAIKYAEQGRATVMLSMLRGKYGHRVGMIPQKYKTLEDSLNSRITILTQRLKLNEDDSYNLNSQLDILASKRTNLEQLYKKHYPNYYNLKYSMEVVDPVTFQKSLKSDECVVEFQLNRNFLISFYLDNKNLEIITDTLRNVDLAKLADRFYARVNNFNSLNYAPDSVRRFAEDGYELYKILLKPFEKFMKGKKLTIIADNSLRKIPFEALLVNKPDQITGYKDLPYLLKTTPVYYAPSITFLNELRGRPAFHSRARLLAVAPVYSNLKLNDTISRTLLAVRSDTSIFESLPNAKKEIEFANSIAGGMLLLEKRATETQFKKLAGKYDIIHLATHGILNRDSTLQSKLLFADSHPNDDGFLHNYEIYNLNQQSQLVILSACNTGAGKNYGGEEVISTGRAFLSSGSRSVIMTLWPVNDHASFELIKGFYEGLNNELQVCEALRQSKLQYLEHADKLHSHPFFWSGYVIYGDAAINLPLRNNEFFYLALLSLFVLVPGSVWVVRKIKRSH
jgi:CHAT domain-containing protein